MKEIVRVIYNLRCVLWVKMSVSLGKEMSGLYIIHGIVCHLSAFAMCLYHIARNLCLGLRFVSVSINYCHHFLNCLEWGQLHGCVHNVCNLIVSCLSVCLCLPACLSACSVCQLLVYLSFSLSVIHAFTSVLWQSLYHACILYSYMYICVHSCLLHQLSMSVLLCILC